MTQNGKKSEFEFFARNEVGICSDSYHSARNLLGSARIPSIPLVSAQNVSGRVKYWLVGIISAYVSCEICAFLNTMLNYDARKLCNT